MIKSASPKNCAGFGKQTGIIFLFWELFDPNSFKRGLTIVLVPWFRSVILAVKLYCGFNDSLLSDFIDAVLDITISTSLQL